MSSNPNRRSIKWAKNISCLVFLLGLVGAEAARSQVIPPSVATHLRTIDQVRFMGRRNARNKAERQLIETDLDFARDAKDGHVSEAFAQRIARHGVLISPEEPVAVGPGGVRAALRDDRSEWHWAPIRAWVNGDLGVTWGVAALVYRSSSGEMKSVHTRYTTVWERRARRWYIALDIGNLGPAPDQLLRIETHKDKP